MCFDALTNLGALYLQGRETDKAIEWLERAHRIDTGDAANNTNLSAYHVRQDNISKRFKACLGRHGICCSR